MKVFTQHAVVTRPKLVVLVTGECGAGKGYCADLWACVINRQRKTKARVASISDATKREYAAASGADLNRLLHDRAYKGNHRAVLTKFFGDQLRERPRLPEEHFSNLVYGAARLDVDVLLITGMRDKAPVAAFSHLVPESRVVEVRVQASQETRETRRGNCSSNSVSDGHDNNIGSNPTTVAADLKYDRPTLVFENDAVGKNDMQIESFSELNLLPYLSDKLQRLECMVRSIPDFPRLGVEFRHVLGIAQRTGGLALCTSLLQSHFDYGFDWAKVDDIAACETGGFVFASALAARVGVPLALIREESKLPPPTMSVANSSPSYISSMGTDSDGGGGGEVGPDCDGSRRGRPRRVGGGGRRRIGFWGDPLCGATATRKGWDQPN
ncbi:hypothetical protein PG994_013760 [Apiospora phragmitis]|uniref:Phosphomevalonate kinase n=1 Tax=Apiospora phragmitis TaxID=2905665 RepID=A0ABR1T2E7_9PEZI